MISIATNNWSSTVPIAYQRSKGERARKTERYGTALLPQPLSLSLSLPSKVGKNKDLIMRSPPFFYPPSQFRYRGCDKPSLRLLELIQRATLGTKHTLIWKSCTLRDKILLPRWTLSGHQMSSTLSLPTRLMANAFDQAVRISDGSIPKYWYSWDTIYMKKNRFLARIISFLWKLWKRVNSQFLGVGIDPALLSKNVEREGALRQTLPSLHTTNNNPFSL